MLVCLDKQQSEASSVAACDAIRLAVLQMNGGEDIATRSRAGAKSSRARSEWAHSGVFSSDEEAAAPGARSRASQWGDARSAKAARSKAPTRQVRQPSG